MKKDWSLRLAIALPFVMILLVAASVYLPRFWAPAPKYGFIYTVNDSSKGYFVPAYTFRVENGKLTKDIVDRDESLPETMKVPLAEPRLYRYDVSTGESEDVSFDEAQQLKLDDRKRSPDGFNVIIGGGNSGPFDGNVSQALYMTGHLVSRKLDLRGVKQPYDFEFIGWITE